MAEDNKGIIYEYALNKKIHKYGAYPPGFRGAGPDSNLPDAWIRAAGIDYKVEVKLDMKVDFGQGSLDYDTTKKKWILGGAKTTSGKFMREFLESIKVPALVNKEWGKYGPPRKFTVPPKHYTQKDVTHDYKYFTDRFVPLSGTAISNYYNSKKTYYIHVGGHGLYYMGKDVARLGVEPFNLKLKLRIRLKRGGSHPIYNYRFTTAIQSTGMPPKTEKSLDDISYLKALGARADRPGNR